MNAVFLCAAALALTPSMTVKPATANPLVGTWHLIRIDEQGPDRKIIHHADLKGSLIYTPDGRVSVQVIYPGETLTNNYVLRGYEASFGHYIVHTREHRVTHHIEAANVRNLIGAELQRSYSISGKRLTIRPVSSDEHWAVTWERY